MNAHSPDGKGPAFEAANWLVVLAEEPVAEDVRADFEAWLAASPANGKAWRAATETYDLMGHARQRQDAVLDMRRGRRVRPGLTLAAALAACMVIAAAPSLWLRMSADRVTGTAELASMTLDDGSIIRLGPDSAVRIAYDADERRVALLAGEASFDVTANPARPFRVEAGAVRTTVLGTAFEVRRERGGTWVAVSHGRVRVDGTRDGLPMRRDLADGEWLRVDDAFHVEHGAGTASEAPPDRAMIVVKDRPVTEVIDRLRPWYAGAIVVTDAGLGRQRVTGAYDPRDPAKALDLLLGAHGGSVRQITPWMLLVTKSSA